MPSSDSYAKRSPHLSGVAGVEAIPTRYMKRQTRLRRIFGRMTLLNMFIIFALLVVLATGYAWKVSIARKLEQQTAAAKALYEQNMNLEVELNKLKSFNNIDQALSKVPNLVAAREKRMIQSSVDDWHQPILLGQERLNRHPEYVPMSGF